MVFCENCKYYEEQIEIEKLFFGQTAIHNYPICNYSDNMEKKHSAINEWFVHKKSPLDLNEKNNCKWFKKKD